MERFLEWKSKFIILLESFHIDAIEIHSAIDDLISFKDVSS